MAHHHVVSAIAPLRARLAALLLSLATMACGSHVAADGGSSETGGDPSDAEPLADLDLDEWCDPVQPLGFEMRGAGRPVQFGACGHLHVDIGQQRIVHPDGHDEVVGMNVDELRLSPTGHLVAWGHRHTTVQLRDLRDDAAVWASDRTVESFGFVRTRDAALGARLWTCGSDGLALEDPAGYELLSATANCNAIVAAGGRARLLFADASTDGSGGGSGGGSGTVTAVDIDSGTLHPSEVVDFEHVFPTGLDEHADRLAISYDGRLAIHEIVVEVNDWATGEQVVMGHRLIDLLSGRIIETCAWPTFLQAERAGAPLWVQCNDALLHFDGTLERVGGSPRAARVAAESGTLVIELDGVLVRLRPDAPMQPETIAEPSTAVSRLEVSASGDAVAFIEDRTLFRWTAARGLEPIGTSVSQSTASWVILALADDGRLLAWAQREGDDQARPLVIDADGNLTSLDPIDGRPSAYGTFADGRVLVRSSVAEPYTQSLLIIDPTDGSANVIVGPTPIDLEGMLYLPSGHAIDPRSQLVAGSLGYGELYYGNGL